MFSTARSSNNVEHDGKQLKEFQDLTKVLNAVQADIKRAEVEHQELLKKGEKKEALEKELGTLEAAVKGALSALRQVQKEIEEINQNRIQLDRSRQEEEKVLNEFLEHKEKIVKEIRGLEQNWEELYAKTLTIDRAYKSKEESYTNLENRHETFSANHEKEKAEKKKDLEQLDMEVSERRKEKAALDNSLVEDRAEKTELGNHLEKASAARDSLYAENRKEMERHLAEMAKINHSLDERETGVKKREGDASLKESWLLDKENSLKTMKAELEKHFNRKFDHIKF